MKNSLKSQWKNENNGFTLVELIVTITILVILAAMLIPTMVGWIDRSKAKSYAVEARVVYLAAQTVESDHYDAPETPYLGYDRLRITDMDGKCEEVKKLSGVNVLSIQIDRFSSGFDSAEAHDILEMRVEFVPKGKSDITKDAVTMKLKDGTWTKLESFEDDLGDDSDYDSENEFG